MKRAETPIVVVGNFMVLVALAATISTWFLASLIAGGIILIGYRTSVRRLVAILDAGGGQKDALTWGTFAVICLAAAILAVVFINRQGQPL